MYYENIIFDEMARKYKNFYEKKPNFGGFVPVLNKYFKEHDYKFTLFELEIFNQKLKEILEEENFSIIGEDFITEFLSRSDPLNYDETDSINIIHLIKETMLDMDHVDYLRSHMVYVHKNLTSFLNIKDFNHLVYLLDSDFQYYVEEGINYGFFFNDLYSDEKGSSLEPFAVSLCYIPVMVIYDTLGLYLCDIVKNMHNKK